MPESRTWLFSKPDDQTPYAEAHKLEDVVAELKQKGQAHLVWVEKPGEKPRLVNIGEKAEKSFDIPIVKADEAKHLVYGVVLEPDIVDAHGDVVGLEEIERACHAFMVKSRKIYLEHSEARPDCEIVECYLAPQELEWDHAKVKKGSWVLGVHIGDKGIWQQVKSGELTGFSIRGWGRREAVA